MGRIPAGNDEERRGDDSVAGKDVAEKILESYNDVFSDIVNVLLFNGKEVVASDELEDQAPRSWYKADGKVREMERDVAKRWKKGKLRVACIGLENQTEADADMPLRAMGYDGAEYRSQLLRDNPGGKRYPVVTLVLYFGHNRRWDKPLRLKERLEIPPELDGYVNDYRINLFEIAWLRGEQVERFRSDFRIVADYFVQKRETGDYTPDGREMEHVEETLQLLSAMTGDNRFEEAYERKGKGGPRNMCEVLDRVEEKGRQEGRLEGRKEGRQEGRQEEKRRTAANLHGMGMTEEFIAKAVGVSVDLVKEWLSAATA